jgi:hypothetical protein
VVFLQLGVLFAVLLAFMFNDVWSEYNEALSRGLFMTLSMKSSITVAML